MSKPDTASQTAISSWILQRKPTLLLQSGNITTEILAHTGTLVLWAFQISQHGVVESYHMCQLLRTGPGSEAAVQCLVAAMILPSTRRVL